MRLTVSLLLAVLLAGLGCGGTAGPTGEVILTMQNLSGIYYVTTFSTEEGGVLTNQLTNGATIELVLSGDGVTGGALFLPADPVSGLEVDVNLAGTWQLDGNVVTLSLAANTFFQDMDLVFEDTHLTGETTNVGVTYRVVLAW